MPTQTLPSTISAKLTIGLGHKGWESSLTALAESGHPWMVTVSQVSRGATVNGSLTGTVFMLSRCNSFISSPANSGHEERAQTFHLSTPSECNNPQDCSDVQENDDGTYEICPLTYSYAIKVSQI